MRLPLRSFLQLLLALLGLAAVAPHASASTGQVAMFEDDAALPANPAVTLATLRSLGVGVIRISVHWSAIAPDPYASAAPAGFDPASPSASGYAFTQLDTFVRTAVADGITPDLSLTGNAPLWAAAPHHPGDWEPSAAQYGQFVQAVAARYGGHYAPPGATTLPAVHMWELWNEPNLGTDLAPQAVDGSRVPTGAPMYRALVDAGWAALSATGHGHDTVILGNLDARGEAGPPSRGAPQGYPGVSGATKPLLFVRQLYCLDSRFHPLRGAAARAIGCPASGHGFRSAHPGLFAASGFGDHPYPLTLPPTESDSRDPDFAEFSQLPRLIATVDAVQRAYGSGHRFAIYNNEYGYITNPPNHSQHFPSPALAAAYINEAEYLSWRNPRIASTMQFLLVDPNPHYAPEYGGFASGLEFYGGTPKPSYNAYRLPIYLPVTTVRRGARVLVWGCARPAHVYGQRQVVVEFQAGSRGAFRSIATVTVTNPRGYFTVRVPLRTSGTVRLAWSYPGQPPSFSRSVRVNVR